MPTLDESEAQRHVHIIVYGPPKVGKTELIGELVNHGFTLWYFDFENGSNTLVRSVPKELHKKINLFKIPDTKDFPIGIETALKVVKPGSHRICDVHGVVLCPGCIKIPGAKFSIFDNTKLGPMDIAVFDSLTQISNSAMARMYKKNSLDETDKPGWDEYNPQGIMLDKFLTNIQAAPYNTVITSHENVVKLADGKTEKMVPVAGTTNFSRNAAKYFDEVVYMKLENSEHKAFSDTAYSSSTLTGSRSRTKIEDQFKQDPTKPVVPINQRPHLSLLPIFQNLGIGVPRGNA